MTLEDKIRMEIKAAREEGIKEGIEKGKAKGKNEERTFIAKRLKEVLGLSDEQIKEIINEK